MSCRFQEGEGAGTEQKQMCRCGTERVQRHRWQVRVHRCRWCCSGKKEFTAYCKTAGSKEGQEVQEIKRCRRCRRCSGADAVVQDVLLKRRK